MTDIHWEAVKEFYQSKFGIDGWVVEMYANLDILSLCVSGTSNDKIVEFLELPVNEVIRVLVDTLKFEGWREDLPINPYRLFNMFSGTMSSVEHFIQFTGELSLELQKYQGRYSEVNPIQVFYMCETFKDIEDKINDEWK